MALPSIPAYALPTVGELPLPRGAWRPQASRIALLVHDMQRYFLSAFTADASPLTPAIANIARLLAHARANGIPVFYTAQRGQPAALRPWPAGRSVGAGHTCDQQP